MQFVRPRHRDREKEGQREKDKKTRRQGDKETRRKTPRLLVPPSPCLPLSFLCGSVAPWHIFKRARLRSSCSRPDRAGRSSGPARGFGTGKYPENGLSRRAARRLS